MWAWARQRDEPGLGGVLGCVCPPPPCVWVGAGVSSPAMCPALWGHWGERGPPGRPAGAGALWLGGVIGEQGGSFASPPDSCQMLTSWGGRSSPCTPRTPHQVLAAGGGDRTKWGGCQCPPPAPQFNQTLAAGGGIGLRVRALQPPQTLPPDVCSWMKPPGGHTCEGDGGTQCPPTSLGPPPPGRMDPQLPPAPCSALCF